MSVIYSVFVRFNKYDEADPYYFCKKDSYIGSFNTLEMAESIMAVVNLDKYEFARDADDTWSTFAFVFHTEINVFCENAVEVVGDQISEQKRLDWNETPAGIAHYARSDEEHCKYRREKIKINDAKWRLENGYDDSEDDNSTKI